MSRKHPARASKLQHFSERSLNRLADHRNVKSQPFPVDIFFPFL